jgi:hypothetical protein
MCVRVQMWINATGAYQPYGNYTKNNVETELAMPLTTAAEFLEFMTPIAEAVPVLGAPVKGAMEATSKILRYAQVGTSEDHNDCFKVNSLLGGELEQRENAGACRSCPEVGSKGGDDSQ